MSLSAEKLLFLAKLCEETESYEDMIYYIKEYFQKHPYETNAEERNLFSLAYKNFVHPKKYAWRVLCNLKTKEDSSKAKLLESLMGKVQKEIESTCHEVINFIDKTIFHNCQKSESKVFFLKMKGDYYRYLNECLTGEAKAKTAENGFKAYTQAMELAKTDLKKAHPIRLGLALNFSTFYYEILNKPKIGRELSMQAFNEALMDLEDLDEEEYRSTTTILQLLRDGLTMWSIDDEEENPEVVN